MQSNCYANRFMVKRVMVKRPFARRFIDQHSGKQFLQSGILRLRMAQPTCTPLLAQRDKQGIEPGLVDLPRERMFIPPASRNSPANAGAWVKRP